MKSKNFPNEFVGGKTAVWGFPPCPFLATSLGQTVPVSVSARYLSLAWGYNLARNLGRTNAEPV